MKRTLAILIISFLIFIRVSGQIPAQVLPDFNFYKPDKSLFTDKNIPHDKLLFFLFFDPDCEHCQHALVNFNQHFQEYKKVSVYLISASDKDKINQFVQKYAPTLTGMKNVTLLYDTRNEFISRFNPRRFPAMFLYSSDKKLADYEDNEESMFRFLKYLNAPKK